ncbi:MAG: hypothetical protein PHT15_00950 [Gallionellaceae bacterium]|nr:hypothetical protein [Gallionellaceae bacterium]
MPSEYPIPPSSGRQAPEADVKQTPIQLLAILVVATFTIEMSIMVVFTWLPLPSWLEALIDATFLTALLFPILYFLVFRPLTMSHAQQMLVQRQLEKRLDELQRFHKVAMGRELRMKELYEENQALKARLGEPGSP